jgi:antitoxin component YwqK of YwqJK toxin-antitoxin module
MQNTPMPFVRHLASLFFLIALAFASSSCNSDKSGKKDEDHAAGTEPKPVPAPIAAIEAPVELINETDLDGNSLTYSILAGSEIKHGTVERTSPKGVLLEQMEYLNGKLEGLRILYTAKGDTQIVETYRHGVFEGPYKLYHPNGKLKTLGQYLNNSMDGTWNQYYETGVLKESVTFDNNLENGPFKEYHPNGKLSVEGNYLNGDSENGPLKFYDKNGVHIKTMDCKKGICKTIWKKS